MEEYQLQLEACKSFSLGDDVSASGVDIYRNNFTSIQNLMCQLNSLATVTQLWRNSGVHYDAVAYMRPDVLYNCPFPVKQLEELKPNTVYIPDFHHWRGLNDRFAMGEPHVVHLWGERCAFFDCAVCLCALLDCAGTRASLLRR